MKKKIGLITLHRWYNYGSMLQAYALNCILNEDGYACELIDFTPPKIDNNRSYKLYNNVPELEELRTQYKDEIENRKVCFENFMKLYKCGNRKYDSDEELEKEPPCYDAYVTGSDQIWNVNMRIASRAYFLSFADCEEKFAFAASIGRCKEDKLQPYAKYINDYKKIYMREKDGAELIGRMFRNKDISVMIDPTLMLEKTKWNSIVTKKD